MKIVRFKAKDKTRYGVLEGTHIVEYAGTPFGPFKRGRRKYPIRQSVLLSPVVPSKIAALALNYRDLADEMNRAAPAELHIFFKPVSALCGPDDPIVLPANVGRVDFEGELAIVIRKRAHLVSPDRAREHVLGYTCLNDVTARELHGREGQATRAKAFDTFCPVGPCISTEVDPNGADLETYVNGERRQVSNTKHLVIPVDDIVSRVSAVMTLLPGDLIATGTPAGRGPIRAGDRVEVRIEGIGCLRNPVITL